MEEGEDIEHFEDRVLNKRAAKVWTNLLKLIRGLLKNKNLNSSFIAIRNTTPCLLVLWPQGFVSKLSLLNDRGNWLGVEGRQEGGPQEIQIRSMCHLYLGIGHNCKAGKIETREEMDKLKESVLRHLQVG